MGFAHLSRSSLIVLAVFSRASVLFPAGRKVFRDFLRCEYSEENILFWLACEELKKESNPDVVEEKARFIYEDYISILSPKEVIMKEKTSISFIDFVLCMEFTGGIKVCLLYRYGVLVWVLILIILHK